MLISAAVQLMRVAVAEVCFFFWLDSRQAEHAQSPVRCRNRAVSTAGAMGYHKALLVAKRSSLTSLCTSCRLVFFPPLCHSASIRLGGLVGTGLEVVRCGTLKMSCWGHGGGGASVFRCIQWRPASFEVFMESVAYSPLRAFCSRKVPRCVFFPFCCSSYICTSGRASVHRHRVVPHRHGVKFIFFFKYTASQPTPDLGVYGEPVCRLRFPTLGPFFCKRYFSSLSLRVPLFYSVESASLSLMDCRA